MKKIIRSSRRLIDVSNNLENHIPHFSYIIKIYLNLIKF